MAREELLYFAVARVARVLRKAALDAQVDQERGRRADSLHGRRKDTENTPS